MSSETPLTPVQVQKIDSDVDHEGYIARLPRALDIFANELFGGQVDETISSRMQRWKDEEPAGTAKHDIGSLISHGLDIIQRQHGQQAEEADKERAKQVIAVEDKAQQ